MKNICTNKTDINDYNEQNNEFRNNVSKDEKIQEKEKNNNPKAYNQIFK